MTDSSKHDSAGLPIARSKLRFITVPLMFFSVALVLFVLGHTNHDQLPSVLYHVFATVLWIAGTHLLNRLTDMVLWDGIKRARGHPIPALLRNLVTAIIWFSGFCGVIIFVFHHSVTTMLTASAVVMGVIGFTLKDFIEDAFAGMVIGFQQPFKEGDWIQFDPALDVGRITEISWRSVSMVTPNEITFLVSNSKLLNNYIRIYSHPELFFRDEIQITLPYVVTAHQAQRILLGAANQVEDVAAIPRKSIVSVADYTERGVLWRLLYWCPNPGSVPAIRFNVHQNIMRNLYYVGIQIPAPMRIIQNLPPAPVPPEDEAYIDKMLARIHLFSGLTNQELTFLSLHAKTSLFKAGQPILRQGEPGNSLFVLREGLLVVQITNKNNAVVEVGRISSGQFFGERSLLLGEVRSATIVPVVDSTVTEITKLTMSKLLHDRPGIVTYLSEVLSERIENRDKLEAMSNTNTGETRSMANQILKNIRMFFGLTG